MPRGSLKCRAVADKPRRRLDQRATHANPAVQYCVQNAEAPISDTPKQVYEYVASQSNWRRALDDLAKGWERRKLWSGMAVRAFNNRYKGAVVGAFWLTITTAMTASGLGVLYGKLLGAPLAEQLPYVTTGIICWALISAYATGGCDVFVGASNIFKEFPLPLSLFAYRLALQQLIHTGYRSIVLLVIFWIFPSAVAPTAPLAIVGFLLILWIGFWMSIALGVVNARYRDFGQMVSAAMMFFFFMTPIFWKGDRLGELSFIVNYNPFYHFINTVRGPLLGLPGYDISFTVTCAAALIAPLIAFGFYGRFSHRLPYWC